MSTMEDQAEKFREQKKNNGLLLVAASRGYLGDVEALLEMGAALDCKDKQGRGPLHFAAANGRLPVVRHLWSRNAEIDAETPEGRTPLHLAALGGHAEVATFLLQKSAWAEAYDAADDTPLHLAAKHGHTAVIESLLQHGAKVGAKNKQGLTAMACALVGGNVAAAKLLQGWGAGLSDRPHGYSLLHLAAGVGALPSVSFLLESGADANEHSNAEGATPLHSVALGGCAHCAEALLGAGADPGLPDAQGRLPADLAAPQDERMRELLKAKGRSKAKAAAPAAKAGSALEPKSAQEQFRALPKAEQLGKVERWSLLEGEDLTAALKTYPAAAAEEVTARIAQLQAARRLLNIQKAMAALHADDDFQGDIAQPRVREAIDAIRADTGKYEHYAADPQILAVLQKMRRMHGVAQANGQRTVGIEDMIAQPGQQRKDEERQMAIEAGCNAHLAAAAAAAACAADEDAAAAAKAAFDAAFAAAKEAAMQAKQKGASAASKAAASGEGQQSAKLAAAEGSAASILRQRGGQPAGAAAGGRVAEDEAAARVHEEREQERQTQEEANVPEWMRGDFSWRKVWAEVWRQTQLSLLMLALFLLGSWLVRGRAPWTP